MLDVVKTIAGNLVGYDALIILLALANYLLIYLKCRANAEKVYSHFNTKDSVSNLTDEQKKVFLRLMLDQLNENGRILIGDVAFRTRRELEACRQETGDEWDDEEIYFVVDEMKKEFPGLEFIKVSYCAGILSFTR